MIITAVVYVGCGMGEPSSAPTPREVTAGQVMVLGADQSAPVEQLFTFPVDVVTDSAGRIYVADEGSFEIRVFGPEGRFLRAFGGEGRAPGEFRDFKCLAIDRDGTLLVSDAHNRRISRFRPTGELLETYALQDQVRSGLAPIGSDSYLTLYLKFSEQDPAEMSAFHVYGGGFTRITHEFGSLDTWGYPRDSVWVTLNRLYMLGHFWQRANGHLLHAPGLYTGRIYVYDRRDGRWTITDTLEGVPAGSEPYRVVDRKPAAGANSAELHTAGRQEPTHLVYPAESEGIYELRDRRLVHLSKRTVGDSLRLYVEWFRADGRLVGHGPAPTIANAETGAPLSGPRYRVVWKDRRDRFYMVDRRAYPVIRVLELSLENAPTSPET